ncbi:MAG: hypothetical protein LH629_06020 [Ignavibacteria bacterium]|nr:hypothetical protein [Ignavibacteria bacterium]
MSKNQIIKTIPVKADHQVVGTIDILSNKFILLPSASIDVSTAIGYIDAIQKSIEYLRKNNI